VDIGVPAANRLIIVSLCANAGTVTSVTVNGVSWTEAGTSGSNPIASLWYGVVASGSGPQSIVVTGATFFAQVMAVYRVVGLGSNSPQATATGANTATISVNSGDFMFVAGASQSASSSWAASTQAPSDINNDSNQNPVDLSAADWIIAFTNTSFSISFAGVTGSLVASNFR
jgi:hypothetical protein